MEPIDMVKSEGYANGDIIKVPVTFLMKFLTRSCDVGDLSVWYSESGGDDWRDYHGWRYLMENKAQDEGFGYLVESMMEKGHLPNGAIAVDDTGYIFEGHHRLVAAILLCLDEVYIKNGGTSHHRDPSLPHVSAHGAWGLDPYPIPVEYA